MWDITPSEAQPRRPPRSWLDVGHSAPAVVTVPKEDLSRSRIAKGLALTSVAAAAVAGTAGIAAADSGASGSADSSLGVLSGNVLQVPVHIPVNVCGNTVDVVGLLNPAFGN